MEFFRINQIIENAKLENFFLLCGNRKLTNGLVGCFVKNNFSELIKDF